MTGPDEGVSFGFTRECPRGISLSRTGKKRHPVDLLPLGHDPSERDLADRDRRDFLLWCCQGASAALIYPGLRGLAFPFAPDSQKLGSPGEFHLHPHYRGQLPIEATLLKTQAGFDQFVTEKYQDRIAAVLADWSAGLLAASQDMRAVEKILAPGFSGASFQPVESRLVRSGPAVEIRQNKFARDPVLGRDAFLRDLRGCHGVLFETHHR